MKADLQGRPAEQTRALMGWKSRIQIEVEGGDRSRRCGRCRFVFVARVLERGGRPTWPFHCSYPRQKGWPCFQTRKGATCKHWELRA